MTLMAMVSELRIRNILVVQVARHAAGRAVKEAELARRTSTPHARTGACRRATTPA